MSLHVLSHAWEVQEVKDGTLVRITQRDLDVETMSILADELFELALESDPSTLYLDFGQVRSLPSVVFGKLFALERKLRDTGGRLVVRGLNRASYEADAEPDESLSA